MSLFFQPKSGLGVDLGAGGVKLVELRQIKHRPVLQTYGYTSEADKNAVQLDNFFRAVTAQSLLERKNTERVRVDSVLAADMYFSDAQVKEHAGILKAVYKQSKATAKSAVVSLPASAVFHTLVTIPKTDKEEFNSILRAEVKKLLPMSLSDMMLDYQILPGAKEDKNQRVLVNAVPRSLVVFYSQVFKRANLKLDALEPESTALARSLVGRDNCLAMIVDIGAERTNFFIVDQGVPVTHHSLEIGGTRFGAILRDTLGIDENLVEQVKYDLSVYVEQLSDQLSSSADFLKIFMPVVEPITKEIRYGFDLYLHQMVNEGKRPEKIILTGGGSLLPYLSEYFADQFKIKCYVGDPWARVIYQDGLRPLLSKIGPRLSSSIGLALRDMV
ncbi:MAG: pilus assembly protein PilM [Candidatus Magasanikbacteria bacterium]|jgi:type IV pilus assembly protein PilM